MTYARGVAGHESTLSLEDGLAGLRGTKSVPRLLIALQSDWPAESPSWHALSGLNTVTLGRGAARSWTRKARALALTLADRAMSTDHARLRCENGRWVIADAGSKNGTFVNGHAIEQHELGDGDVIELGRSF